MYKLHLIRKYLFKRRIAWVALVAVMLCTTMVLVVFSVMNGWLQMFEGSFHAMTGDVIVEARNPLGGFPYYDEIAKQAAEKVPGVAAAMPIISNYGLINIGGQIQDMVQVVGYPADIGQVNDWPKTLHGQASAIAQGKSPSFALLPDVNYKSMVGKRAQASATSRPGMIVTGPVVGIEHGDTETADDIRFNMVRNAVTLTLLPTEPGEAVNLQSAVTVPFWIVDDAKSRVYQLDSRNVYVDFAELQRDLHMDGTNGEPARCSQILIRAKAGADLPTIRDAVAKIAGAVTQSHGIWGGYRVKTWREQQVDFINAVRHEVVLTTVLFSLISSVAGLLIFCIFYMIVVEKTKDIGIIKSVGATGVGILSLFLGYGLAIGIVGASLGVGLAYLVVRNINELHAWMGRRLGVEIWSPKTYQFDRIPSNLELRTVVWVALSALVVAAIGAMIPALRAASLNPVDSLRYE